jgi:hypothetical protein
LDQNSGVEGTPGDGPFAGTATSNLTIGVTESISDAFTFEPDTLLISFSGGAAVVFNLGTFEVTVTPIVSVLANNLREANFLETPVPEPSSLTLLASSGLFAALVLACRSRRGRHMPDRS